MKANSLPKELSNLEDLQFDLSFEHSLFRTKSKTLIHDTIIDSVFIQFIESKKNTIHPDIDQHVLDTFDKLDPLTSNLIRHIDEAYFQQSVELVVLIATTAKPSTIPSEPVNSYLFSTTSSIISTTLHSTESFIPKLPLQPRVLFPSPNISSSSSSTSATYSSTSSSSISPSSSSSSTTTLPPSQARILAMVARYAPLTLPAQVRALPQDY